MSDTEDTDFGGVDAGASKSTPLQCSALRKGGHVLMKGHPCKIVDMSTSKTGKHGHAKVNMVGIDIFTGKKYEDICPSTHNVEVPIVLRRDYDLINIDEEGFLSLLDDNMETKEDLKIPDGELGEQIRITFNNEDSNGVLVTVVASMGTEMVLAMKNKTSGKD